VSASGAVLDPNGVAVPGPDPGLLASAADGGVRVVWQNLNPVSIRRDVRARVPATSPAGNIAASSGAPQQNRPDAAVGNNGSMVVFRSDVSGDARIMAQPLSAARHSDYTGTHHSRRSRNRRDAYPTVAWNGSVYLATWSDGSTVFAQRRARTARAIDPAPFTVMPGFGPWTSPRAGNLFLVIGHQLQLQQSRVHRSRRRARARRRHSA
jgi:hypothetical protein